MCDRFFDSLIVLIMLILMFLYLIWVLFGLSFLVLWKLIVIFGLCLCMDLIMRLMLISVVISGMS